MRGCLEVYDEIEPELRQKVEDVVLAKDDEAGERLLNHAEDIKDQSTKRKAGELTCHGEKSRSAKD